MKNSIKVERARHDMTQQDLADRLAVSRQTINAIEKGKKYFSHRLYREHSTVYQCDFLKDLSKIGRDLSKIVIVDDKPSNFFFQRNNGIQIKPFWGNDYNNKVINENAKPKEESGAFPKPHFFLLPQSAARWAQLSECILSDIKPNTGISMFLCHSYFYYKFF